MRLLLWVPDHGVSALEPGIGQSGECISAAAAGVRSREPAFFQGPDAHFTESEGNYRVIAWARDNSVTVVARTAAGEEVS
jgi:hypothetical protein